MGSEMCIRDRVSQCWFSVSVDSAGQASPPSAGAMQFLVLDLTPVVPQLHFKRIF